MKQIRSEFIVSLVIPTGATKTDVIDYIQDSVGSWGGSLHPDDPLFRIGDVKVRSMPRAKKAPPT